VPSVSQPPEEEKPRNREGRTLGLDEMNESWKRLIDKSSLRRIVKLTLIHSEITEFKNDKFLVEILSSCISEIQKRELMQWQPHLNTELRKYLRAIDDSEIQFVTKGSKELRSN
jgi:hypothetical protein